MAQRATCSPQELSQSQKMLQRPTFTTEPTIALQQGSEESACLFLLTYVLSNAKRETSFPVK